MLVEEPAKEEKTAEILADDLRQCLSRAVCEWEASLVVAEILELSMPIFGAVAVMVRQAPSSDLTTSTGNGPC